MAGRADTGVVWLNLEIGTARALNRRDGIHVGVPSIGSQGRRALVVEACHTYLPEAGIETMPELARDEVAAGLSGPVRSRIAQTAPDDDPALLGLRKQLMGELGVTADVTGALTLLDRVYAGRLLRGQVPPIITASCLAWYGHWRHTNTWPAVATADDWVSLVEAWISSPEERPAVDARILAHAEQLAVHIEPALEDMAV